MRKRRRPLLSLCLPRLWKTWQPVAGLAETPPRPRRTRRLHRQPRLPRQSSATFLPETLEAP